MLVRDVIWPDQSRGPALQWTNTSLLHRACPKEDIERLMARLGSPDGQPARELAQALAPLDVAVRTVKLNFLGPCLATLFKPFPRNKPEGENDDANPPRPPVDDDNRVSGQCEPGLLIPFFQGGESIPLTSGANRYKFVTLSFLSRRALE